MERIGVIGTNWRSGQVTDLAPWTIPVEERPVRLPALRDAIGARELVYLATCNRVEIVLAAGDHEPIAAFRPRVFRALTGRDPEPGEAERIFRAWGGEGAVEHLFLVASGLDSAKVGETEIHGQLRDALEAAREAGLAGPRTERILSEALRVAARVHTRTELGRGRTSLAEIAIERIAARLERHPGAVALVGVSPMTRRAAEKLAKRPAPIFVVNRTRERAVELAAQVGGTALSLDEFRESPPAVEAVLSATASPEPILGRTALERLAARTPSGEPTLVVDMAIPPDVDPAGARAAGVRRLDMDDIVRLAEEGRRGREAQYAEARAIVDEALAEFLDQIADRMLGPMMSALQRRYRHTALTGIDRLCRRELSGLGPEQIAAIRAWAETLAHRFAHVPASGLRAVAREHGLAPVERFFEAGDELLAKELREVHEEALQADAGGNGNGHGERNGDGARDELQLREQDLLREEEDA
ncbi:MAG: glutamyl-tRNA reductase [bacterium]